jgi:hypothetical protein
VDSLCGGCTFIQSPKDFEPIWKSQRDTEKEKSAKDRKDRNRKKKATAAARESAQAEVITAAVTAAFAAQASH